MNISRKSKTKQAILNCTAALGLALMLSACGGGGSGNGGVNTTPPPPPAPPIPNPPVPNPPVPNPPVTPNPDNGNPDNGNGGGSEPPPTGPNYIIDWPIPTEARSVNDTVEYRQNYQANELIGLLYAMDSGWTGKGVTVAVVDNGIDTTNPEFAGRISEASKDFGTDYQKGTGGIYEAVSGERSIYGPNSNHGTQVAGIIAAERNGVGIVGVASGATIAALRTDDYYRDDNGHKTTTANIAAALNYSASQKFPIVNLSLGIAGNATDVAAAADALAATGGLMVWAAGNSGGAEPESTSVITAQNRNNTIFVGGLNSAYLEEYTMHQSSNKAGSFADRFIVTDYGAATISAGTGTQTFLAAGTSSAAPRVAGAAALLLEKWPQLTGAQAGQILLDTAKDIGAPGVDEIYGNGLLDLQAALSPVNPSINGRSTPDLATSFAALPAGVNGSGIVEALSDVTVIDRYGRDYKVNLSANVLQAPRQAPSVARQAMLMHNSKTSSLVTKNLVGSFNYQFADNAPADMPRAAFSSGYVAGSFGKAQWSFALNQGFGGDPETMGLGATTDAFSAYAPQADKAMSFDVPLRGGRIGFHSAVGNTEFGASNALGVEYTVNNSSVRVGLVNETGSLFGAASQGALSLGTARSFVLDMGQNVNLGMGWAAKAYGSLGLTHIGASNSVFTGGNLLSSRYGFSLSGPISKTARVSFGFAQPLTIESGKLNMDLGSGYDLATRSLVMKRHSVALGGGQRPFLLTGGYAADLGARKSLRLGLAYDTGLANASALLSFRSGF